MKKANVTHKRCQCPACGEVFSTLRNFDKHRQGPWEKRVCVHPSSVGLVVKGNDEDGYYWSMPPREAL